MSETSEGFQKALDSLYYYCHQWKLDVSSKRKDKGLGRLTAKDVFRHGDEVLDIMNSFNHLGVKFSKLGLFAKCKNSFDKASKAMFCLISTARKKDLLIHAILDLADNMAVPVLL